MFYMLIEQDMGQRCLAGKSPKTVRLAALLAGAAFLLIALAPIFVGMSAAAKGMDLSGSPLLNILKLFTVPSLFLAFVVTLLMVVSSAMISLLCSVSSHLAWDFPWLAKKSLPFAKAQMFLVGFAAFFVAIYAESILGVLMLSYKICVITLFVPMVMAFWRGRGEAMAAGASMICGFLSFSLSFCLGFEAAPFTLPLTLSCSLAAYFVGHKLAKKPSIKLQLSRE